MTHGGILIVVVGTLLANHFSEDCATEITQKVVEWAPIVVGGITAWIGRFRKGDVSLAGFKR